MLTAEALAFDMYGTLVNPIRIWKQLEQYVSNGAVRVSAYSIHLVHPRILSLAH